MNLKISLNYINAEKVTIILFVLCSRVVESEDFLGFQLQQFRKTNSDSSSFKKQTPTPESSIFENPTPTPAI